MKTWGELKNLLSSCQTGKWVYQQALLSFKKGEGDHLKTTRTTKNLSFYFILRKITSKDLNLCSVPGASLKTQRGDGTELEGQTGESSLAKDKSQYITTCLLSFWRPAV